jgi:hypothetical protein
MESGEIKAPLAKNVLAILETANSPLENNLNLQEQQWRSVANILYCQFESCLFPLWTLS